MNCWRYNRYLSMCSAEECGEPTMILPIPDIRQKDDHDCGDAVVRAVCEYYGIRPRGRQSTPIDGTSPDTLEAALWSLGLHVIAGVMDCDDLRYQTRRSRPVICCVAGHWVIVAGVVRGRVHYHCPINGRQSVATVQYVEHWSDTTRRGVVYPRWGLAVYLP